MICRLFCHEVSVTPPTRGSSDAGAERALHVGRRKEIYEKAKPETKHGGDRKRSSRQNGELNRFTKDAAAKTGKSERSVQRDVTRAGKVEVLAEIAGTSLDKGDEIDALAKLDAKEQRSLAKAAARARSGRAVKRVGPLLVVCEKNGRYCHTLVHDFLERIVRCQILAKF